MAKKLTFLADESIEYSLVLYLRDKRYNVYAIAEESPSITDEEVLSKAYSEKRILLTNDKDFGELIFLQDLPHEGVILFRLKSQKVQDKLKVLDVLLKRYWNKLSGNFVVVDEEKVRIRSQK